MKKVVKEILIEALLMSYLTTVILLFWRENAITSVLIVIGILITLKIRTTKGDIAGFIVGGVLGSFGELVIVSSGAWSYGNSALFGIPLWLPAGWAMTGILIHRFCQSASKWK